MSVRGIESIGKPVLTLIIPSLTNLSDGRFETDPIHVSTEEKSIRDVVIEIHPKRSSIVVFIDGVEKDHVFIPPSSTFFLFDFGGISLLFD